MTDHVVIVGPGRAGLALGQALHNADPEVRITYFGRRAEAPSHPLFVEGSADYHFGFAPLASDVTLLVLAVPDDVVTEVATVVAAHGTAPSGCAALHLSGALTTEVLTPLHARGFSVGSLHPLQAIAHPVTGAQQLEGAYFAVAGEPAAVRTCHRVVALLGGRALSIPASRRPLYHAAAVVASNAIPALIALGARLLVEAGVDEDEAPAALIPLARGSFENVERFGLLGSLTGPASRGDVDTLKLHLKLMEPREREVYRSLGRELVILARARGLDPEAADAMDALFANPETSSASR